MAQVSNNILTHQTIETFSQSVERGDSLERTVALWAYVSLQNAELDYSEGLALLKQAKKNYYETTFGRRIKRVFLSIFGTLAQDKIPDFTWANYKKSFANSTNISDSNWNKIGLYILVNRSTFVKRAKKAGQPILIHANPEINLPRSLVVTPKGEIFVLFNQTGEGKEDTVVGKGATSHAKNAVNFDRGSSHVIVTQHRKEEHENIQRELKILEKLPKTPNFLKLHAVFMGKSKKEGFWEKSYMILDSLTPISSLSATKIPIEKNRVAKTLLESLVKLHKAGIYHRDIKPKNVGISENQGYLFDWDLAMTHKEAKNEGTDLAGTPGYSAQWYIDNSSVQNTEKNDVYGLGLVLFQLYTGLDPKELVENFDNLSRFMKSPAVQKKVIEALNQRMDLSSKLVELIKDMVSDDLTNVPTAKEALKRFEKINP